MATDVATADEVPQWVHRWKHKAKLPTKLRSTCRDFSEGDGALFDDISDPKSPNRKSPGRNKTFVPAPPPPGAPRASAPAPCVARDISSQFSDMHQEAALEGMQRQQEEAAKSFAPVAAPSPSKHDAGVRDVLMMELAEERVRRRDADEGKKAAVELAHHLSMQVDGLREECMRLQMELRHLSPGLCESSEDARGLAAMFKRLAAEAETVAATKEVEEEEAMARDEVEIDTDKMVPMSVALGQKEAEPPATPAHAKDPEKAKEEVEFQELQTNFMVMQYDDMFESLEAREADLTMLLIRASWLRQHHRDAEEGAELLPKKGDPLPDAAKVSAKELKAIFEAAPGCRGYRKVDLPFITLAQFWKSKEHPDPEEEVLQGVIQYLQARWEEFTERDVGIFIDLSEKTEAEDGASVGEVIASPVFWLVTSRARTKMAEAQHDAYMDYMERQKEVSVGGASSSAAGGATSSEGGVAAAGGAKGVGRPNTPTDEGAPGAPSAAAVAALAPEGWSSARSDASAGAQSKSSSRGSEEML